MTRYIEGIRLNESYLTDSDYVSSLMITRLLSDIEELDLPSPVTYFVGDNGSGKSLHEQSHGESFFSLFNNRFGGRGLYILDEPESALSPSRQMSFLVTMNNLVKAGSQFIIATHSPILLAFPKASIYVIEETGINLTSYQNTEAYTLTRIS